MKEKNLHKNKRLNIKDEKNKRNSKYFKEIQKHFPMM